MTFKITTSGAPREVRKDFHCPTHGYFIALVDSDAEHAPCPFIPLLNVFHPRPETALQATLCLADSPWWPRTAPAMRMRRVEATRGNHAKAEHKGWLDTTNLEEGQDWDEFQADREKVHEDLRKDLVMDMVRSDR